MNYIEPIFQLEKNVNNFTFGIQLTETELKIMYSDFLNAKYNNNCTIEKFSLLTDLTIDSIKFIINKFKK